jgi:glycosyltransferase involved in cell wall biosynthesis
MMTHQQLLDKLIEVDQITSRLGRADRVICMSRILEDACLQVGVPAEKITVLGNRVSTTRFQPRPQENFEPHTIRVLFIGRLQEQKNVHGVAQGLAILKKEGYAVELSVCGGVRINRYLRQAVAVLDPQDWHYYGAVPNAELPERYQAVDMYVGPSMFEGFQIPLIEALACGKPCVASDQPPASEIIDSEVGQLVDPTDPADIARGIRTLKLRLNESQERDKISDACRRRAVRKWSYESVSDHEVELYLAALESSDSAAGQEKGNS